MPEAIERLSALAAVYRTGTFGAETPDGPGITLAERRPLTLVHVAGKADKTSFADGVRQATGAALPTEPNTVAQAGEVSLVWLAPERWLVVAPDQGAHVMEEKLRAACGDEAAIIDVSHGRTVIRIAGRKARTLLAKGAPLDFHDKVFTPGQCAQSAIAQCSVLLVCVGDDAFDLYVFRGFGQHMWEWATDAATEFGYVVTDFVNE